MVPFFQLSLPKGVPIFQLFFKNIIFFRWGIHLYMSLFPPVRLSVHLFVRVPVRPSHTIHISEIIHYLTIIFGTRESNGDTSRCFFHFFKIFIFWDFKKLHPSHAISQEQYRYSIRSRFLVSLV